MESARVRLHAAASCQWSAVPGIATACKINCEVDAISSIEFDAKNANKTAIIVTQLERKLSSIWLNYWQFEKPNIVFKNCIKTRANARAFKLFKNRFKCIEKPVSMKLCNRKAFEWNAYLWTTSMSLTLSLSFLLRLMPPNMEDFLSASFSFSRIISAVPGWTLNRQDVKESAIK